MDIISFLIVGLIAGFLAGKIVDGRGFGAVVDIIVGVIGAFIGGLLSSRFIGDGAGLIGSILMATLGAVILLFILKALGGKSPRSV